MKGYGKWFKKQVEFEKRIVSEATVDQKRAALRTFLDHQGFEVVEEGSGSITAKRGRWWPFWERDPRGMPHVAQITYNEGEINVSYTVRSWFTLGTDADIRVFTSELEGLEALLYNGELNFRALEEAQRVRKKADRFSYALVIAGSICLGLMISYFII